MNIFFSGHAPTECETDPRLGSWKRYRLLSCHADYFKAGLDTIALAHKEMERGIEFEWMFDSGAFTAWSKGKHVNLDELMVAYHRMIDAVGKDGGQCWLINLDVIPGSRGVTASDSEIEAAVKQSDVNFKILNQEFGDIVLPVFHQNETTDRLMEVASQAHYICVSPRNDLHEAARKRWSAEVHEKIPDNWTHGLAVTGFEHMAEVSWHSGDSATWKLLGAYGAIFVPRAVGIGILQVSSQSSSLKDRGQHYRTLTEYERAQLDAVFEKYGFTIGELESSHNSRFTFNRIILDVFAREIVPAVRAKAPPSPPSLFDL